jgi:prefoldin subunit 5
MDNPMQALRELFWEEKTYEQRIDKLAEVVENLGRRIMQLEKENSLLSQHQHDGHGDIVVPLVRNEPEYPWYYKHLLGRMPK